MSPVLASKLLKKDSLPLIPSGWSAFTNGPSSLAASEIVYIISLS